MPVSAGAAGELQELSREQLFGGSDVVLHMMARRKELSQQAMWTGLSVAAGSHSAPATCPSCFPVSKGWLANLHLPLLLRDST